MRSILVPAMALAMLGSTASAADMPLKAAAPQDLSWRWTGVYAGGHAGYTWFDEDVNVSFVDGGGAGVAGTVAAGALPLNFTRTRGGFIGGAQVGINWQNNNWVHGFEADFSGTSFDGTSTRNTAVGGFFPLSTSVTQDLEWFGTMRGRLGHAWNNVLVYATGGLAYGSIKYGYTQTNRPGGTINIAISDQRTEVGWTAGAGVEYGWARNWSARFEYLYFDLGDRTLTAPLNTAPATVFFPHFENTGHILRLGLNYRFTSPQ